VGWVVRVPREMLQAQAQVLAEIIDSGTPLPSRQLRGARSGEGDPWRLRGVPVVGARGVGGAIPGTKPESALMSSERWK
jgi:hypothetical protein